MAVSLLPLPPAATAPVHNTVKDATPLPPPEEERINVKDDDADSCCYEADTARSVASSSSSGSSTTSYLGSTILTSSSSGSSLSEDGASTTSTENAATQPNSGAELASVGGVVEAQQKQEEEQQQPVEQALLPQDAAAQSGGGGGGGGGGGSASCDTAHGNVAPAAAASQATDEQEDVHEEEEQQQQQQQQGGHHALSFLEDKAALDKILEESENMSQLTSESDLDDWAAAQLQQQQQQQQPFRAVSYPRPTVITSFTTTSSSSVSSRPSTMSRSQELHFAGSSSSVPAAKIAAAAASSHPGTEIGWARDGRPPPLLDPPADFSINGISAPRRNLRHSGPMPPPSRPLYSPATSPKQVRSGATMATGTSQLHLKSKSEHPSPRAAAAASSSSSVLRAGQGDREDWASRTSREYGRSPSPVNNPVAATPSPARSFYHTGLVSPARTYNPPDFASRAFGHQAFGGLKGGRSSEQGKSQLANLEEELSTLLRNRASNRRTAATNAVPSRLPLPPAGRRGFSMELHRGSHMFGAAPAYQRQALEPAAVQYSDGEDDEEDEYEDEEGDAVYEESMRELEILVRAGSRFNHMATSKKAPQEQQLPPAPVPPLAEKDDSSREQQGAPVEKQVVHVEPSPPKTKLSWAALSEFGPSPDDASAPKLLLESESHECETATTRPLASQETDGSEFQQHQPPKKSLTMLHMSQRSQKKVLKPLGDDDDDFSLENASSLGNVPVNGDAAHAAASSVLSSLNKDVQSLVSRVSWSSRNELRKSRSLDDSDLPDKILPFAKEKIAAEVARANLLQLLMQDSKETGSSSRRLSSQDSRESSSRKLSRQDSRESSSRRLSRQGSRDRSMRKLEVVPGASFRKLEAEAGNSTTASRLGNNGLDRNFPSFKTLTSTDVPAPAKPPMPASKNPNEESQQLDPKVLESLENVAVLRLRGSRRYYGSFADSEADGAQIDLTASPAARFLEDSSIPDDFSQPFRTSASVPFKWEEAPGKPKSPTISGQKAYPLQPPPRLQLVSGPLPSHAGSASSPGPKQGQQQRFSGPQDTDCRSPPPQPEQSIPASPVKVKDPGVSPKRHSLKNVGMPSPESNKKGMSRLQSLLHGGCTLSDVAPLSHALRLPVPPSKEVCRNIDLLAGGDRAELHKLSNKSSEDGLSPSSVLNGPAEMSSSSGSLSFSQRGKEEGPEHLGSFQCFSQPGMVTAQRDAGAADIAVRQPSMKRNRSVRDAAATPQAGTSEDGSISKNHSGRLLGSILNAESFKSGSSRGTSGRSSRRLPVGSGRVSMGRLPSMRAHEYPGSSSEWEEAAPKSPKSPGTSRPLAKKSKFDTGRVLVRVRRFPRFMKTLKRAMRRAFCLGNKSRLGNSQRYTTTPSTMYAITLN